MYWDDWRSNAIFSADKDHGTGIQVVASALPGLMDLKVSGLSKTFTHTSVSSWFDLLNGWVLIA